MEINEDILIRYIDGMLTEEEAAEVKNWRAASLENEKLLEQVYFTTQVASRLKVMRTVNWTRRCLVLNQESIRKRKD